MKYQFIKEYRSTFRIEKMCAVFKISRSGYYRWLNMKDRNSIDTLLLCEIKSEHEKSKQCYGSPRITAALRKKGIKANHKKVERIMKENRIYSKTSRPCIKKSSWMVIWTKD